MPSRPPECSSCPADVIWAQDPGGSYVMLDKERDPASLYAAWRDVTTSLRVRVLRPGEQPGPGEHRHQRHDDTCTARRAMMGSE
jgi:hypothetical protein